MPADSDNNKGAYWWLLGGDVFGMAGGYLTAANFVATGLEVSELLSFETALTAIGITGGVLTAGAFLPNSCPRYRDSQPRMKNTRRRRQAL